MPALLRKLAAFSRVCDPNGAQPKRLPRASQDIISRGVPTGADLNPEAAGRPAGDAGENSKPLGDDDARRSRTEQQMFRDIAMRS
eukprot:6545875-Prymnesium_polylepis.1